MVALIEGLMGRVRVGDSYPVRTMAVINLSQESFYKESVASPNEALARARAFAEEGADFVDLGAVSTAPGSQRIDEAQERERLLPVLKQILENLEIPVSVDTQRPNIAEVALSIGATCINDVSGLNNPRMAKTVANYDASVIIMASKMKPGDLLLLEDIIRLLDERIEHAVQAGVSLEKITIDPGVGRWVPEKTPEYDLAILDGLGRLRCLQRPVMAAVSRKSFIGAKLNEPDPARRLFGSLAATAVAIYNGAHIVRTHDIVESLGAIRMAQAIKGNLCCIKEAGVEAEVLNYCFFAQELREHLRRIGVDQRGWVKLSRKGTFRVVSVKGINFQEAIIIKQEMLARGGDAAISKLALRCDPQLEEILVFGTLAQFIRLIGNLKVQPFRLPTIGKAIEGALNLIDQPERYR